MKTKKGVSALVATVLLILLTVSAVGIIWGAIMPLIDNAYSSNARAFHGCLEDTASNYCKSVGMDYVNDSVAFNYQDYSFHCEKISNTRENGTSSGDKKYFILKIEEYNCKEWAK